MTTDAPLPTVVELYESREGHAYRRWVVLWDGAPVHVTFPSLERALQCVAALLSAWEQWRASCISSGPDLAR